MGFKINIDRHGFSRKPKPERVSRDYAAEYARKLTEDEAAARESRDGELQAAINAEVEVRESQDGILQSAIDLEKAERGRCDSNLQSAITKEIEDRKAAINDEIENRNGAIAAAIAQEASDRDNAISEEAAERQNGDNKLQTKIEQEASDRQDGDNDLRAELETVKNDVADNKEGLMFLGSGKADKDYVDEQLSYKVNESKVEEMLDSKADKATTLAGYGIEDALTVVEEFETNIDNCKNKDVVYKIKQKVEPPFVLRDPITKGYLFVTNNDEPGGIAPYNYTQIFMTYGGIKKRNGTQADMMSPFVWEEWEDYSSNDGSVEIMSQEEFNDLLNSGANAEAFVGKATEALTMWVYDGAIKANANHILTLRDEKADKAYVDEQLGDISTALDEIIALQVEKGGDAV